MAPEIILIVIMWLALTLYALLGGADFGAGVWEFNTALQASEKERKLIYQALGPVWEANHVWLIFLIVMLHTAFPPAFAALSRALWLPLLLALVGIVFRGAAFAFRSYAIGARAQQSLWRGVFALASTAAPFFLGAAAGAVASGDLVVTPQGRYRGDYVTGWLSPLSMFTAFFTVGVCAYLAAVYLTREAKQLGDTELVEKWRGRALATGCWLGILALAGLAFIATGAPALWDGFRQRSWWLVMVSVLTGFVSLWALWRYHFTVAVFGVALTVTTVIWGWGVAQYPMIVSPSLTIASAKGPSAVLWSALGAIGLGAVLLLPSLGYLFYLFKTTAMPTEDGSSK